MFCKNCGMILDGQPDKCPRCGEPTNAPIGQAPNATPPVYPVNNAPQAPRPPFGQAPNAAPPVKPVNNAPQAPRPPFGQAPNAVPPAHPVNNAPQAPRPPFGQAPNAVPPAHPVNNAPQAPRQPFGQAPNAVPPVYPVNNIPTPPVTPEVQIPVNGENMNTGNDVPGGPVYAQPLQPQPAPKKKKAGLIALAVIVPVIIALVVTAILLGTKNKSTVPSTSPSTSTSTSGSVSPFVPGDNKLSALSSDEIGVNFKNEAKNIIMVYMVGSDLESRSGAASYDLKEMCESGINTDNSIVLVYTGGTTHWKVKISSSRNSVFRLHNGDLIEVGRTRGSKNMGDPATLTELLDFVKENYTAETYSLILWDHGGGPLYGYGVDTIFRDRLMIDELYDALKASPFGNGDKLDMIGFDACLMSSVEIADVMSGFADYLVASQETEPGSGWDYAFLSEYDRTSDPEDIGKKIIDCYMNESLYCNFDPELTLACLDLSEVQTVKNAMDTLFGKLGSNIDSGNYAEIARARDLTKEFGSDPSADKGNSSDLIDICDLAARLPSAYKTEAEALIKAVKDMVVYEKSNISGCSGVSLYHPYYNLAAYDQLGYFICENYEGSPEYTSYIKRFAEIRKTGNISSGGGNSTSGNDRAIWDLPEAESDGGVLKMTLTPEQLAQYSSVRYYIFMKSDFDGEARYIPMLYNMSVQPDKNGVISVPGVQNIYRINDSLCSAMQVSSDDGGAKYAMVVSFVSGDFFLDHNGFIYDAVKLSFSDSDGDFLLRSASYNSNATPGEKTTVDISEIDSVYQTFASYIPKYDGNKLLPFSEWETDGWSLSRIIPVNGDIEFSTVDSDRAGEQFCCQIVVKDCYGNSYASELIDLKNDSYKTVDTKTAEGTLTFKVFDDHAELCAYKGSDKKLEIPEKAGGKKVTVICSDALDATDANSITTMGNQDVEEIVIPSSVTHIDASAFSGVSNLKKVTLSEGLISIGTGAFASTSLEEINLPESLIKIGAKAFRFTELKKIVIPSGVKDIVSDPFVYCEKLEEIEVSKDNKNFSSSDGCLYSKDGKKLISGVNKTSIVIPDSVKEIGPYAFSGREALENVTFGKNVEIINRFAFFNTSVKTVTLPDSLREIGRAAFLNTLTATASGLTEVHIPKAVNKIGELAFSGAPITKFTVDENNKDFSADGRFLMSGNGELLIVCASGTGGIITVPDSVKEIARGAFEGFNYTGPDMEKITEIILPDSVLSVKEDLSGLYGLEKISIGASLVEFAGCESIDTGRCKVTLSPDNKAFIIKDGKLIPADSDKKLSFE